MLQFKRFSREKLKMLGFCWCKIFSNFRVCVSQYCIIFSIWSLCEGRHLLTNSSFSLFDYYLIIIIWSFFDYYFIIISLFDYHGKEGICSTELHVPGLEANRLTVTENLFLLLRIFVRYFYCFHLFLQLLAFTTMFFICPYFSSNCYLKGLSTESWNIMTLKVVKATVLMVRSFNENWPTKISTMTMKWKLSDKVSQWNLQLVWYPLFLYMTQCRILGKFEYTRGPIFKVVLEC